MKLLAIDTATEACSAALGVGSTVLARYEELGRGHAERILAMIEELLAEAGIALGGLDAVAFGRGPGAFTGLRLAAGVAQGLAFGADLPVVAVSDLQALAERALAEKPGDGAVVCIDARMSEVYWCAYRRSARQGVEALREEAVSPPDAVTLAGPQPPVGSWLCAGTGFGAYPLLAKRLGVDPGRVAAQLLPRAHEVLAIGRRELAAGRTLAPDAALPIYLRNRVTSVP